MKRIIASILSIQIFILSFNVLQTHAVENDEFDLLREKWVEVLTGGNYPDNGEVYNSYILPRVYNLTSSAQSYWNSMVKKENRVNDYVDSYLWADALMGDTRDMYTRKSSRFSITYARLGEMAVAYRTKGCALEGNRQLLADIIDALDWMYKYKFNESTPRNNRDSAAPDDNWYHWEISGPTHLNNIQALLYENLTNQQIANYQKAIDNQVTTLGSASTGANRLSVCLYLAVAGIVKKDSGKIAYARDAVSPALEYVTVDDGFYKDGSFIQHHTVPYNGAYGLTALGNLSDVMYLLENSSWKLTDSNSANIYEWVENSFLTTTYEGRAMDSVRGRSIARHESPYSFIQTLAKIAFFAPEQKSVAYKSYIKRCYENNLSYDFYANMSSIFSISKFYNIVNDINISTAYEPVFYKQFYGMDRFVHFRPGFSFNAAMYSTRIRNYESINGENLQAWHTGSGMTYLYNSDLLQYDDGFWATIDKYRLPGTTVVKKVNSRPDTFGDSFAGGVVGAERYGVSGMQYKAGLDAAGIAHTLNAKKSWFMFGDEIVALGSGITSSTAGDDIETIIENRKINSVGSNKLMVNGILKPANIGWTESMSNVSWIHLEGNPSLTKEKSSTDIGYYFPTATTVFGLRETKTDSYKSMNTTESSTKYTNNYLSLSVNHGVLPSNKTYAYVLLPGKTSAQVSAYASNPDIEILANTTDVHAAQDKNEHIFGANFWNDKSVTVGNVTCNKRASVMVVDLQSTVEVSISDPTQLNNSVIEITLNRNLGGIISMDPEIAAEKSGDLINISVNMKNSKGKTFKIKFNKSGAVEGPATPTIKSTTALSTTQTFIEWKPVNGATGYKVMRSRSEDGGYAALADVNGETTSYFDYGLGSGIKYYYKIVAINESGISDYSDSALVQTLPEAPFEVYANGFEQACRVTWRNVSGADFYKVFRSENKDTAFVCITPDNYNETYFDDITAQKDMNYFYKVQSVNSSGASDLSKAVSSMYRRDGIVVWDNFDNFTSGKLSGEHGWFAETDSEGKNKAEIIELTDTNKALRITRTVGTLSCGAIRPFDVPQGSIVTVEETIVPEAPSGDYKTLMLITDAHTSGKAIVHAFCQNGSLVVYNGSTRKTVIEGSFDYSKTYLIKAVINTTTKKFDLYVDGVLRASNFSYRDSSAMATPKSVGFSTGNAMNIMTVYNVLVSYTIPTPSGLSLQKLSNQSIELSWNALGLAGKYAVFKSNSANYNYKLIYYGSNNKMVDNQLAVGAKNYYRVAALFDNCVSDLSGTAETICDTNGIYFDSGGVYKGEEKLENLPKEPGKYTVKAKYISTSDKKIESTYMLAVYVNGVLVNIYKEEKSFLPGDIYTFVKEINFLSEWQGKNVFVKSYFWDKTNELRPLTIYSILT